MQSQRSINFQQNERWVSMERLTQWITEHPVVTTWVTLISLMGVILTAIALILQIKDKKKRVICYTVASTVLIDNMVSAIEGIKILFQNDEVSTVAVSNIKLWNGGNEFLEEKDFYPGYELKVVVPEGERILAIAVSEQSDGACNINSQVSKKKLNEALVSFYCLEPRQGATINVYHTNVNDDETKIIGKLKGGRVINKTIEIAIDEGDLYMSVGSYKIYFSGGIWGAGRNIIDSFSNAFGISVIKSKRK